MASSGVAIPHSTTLRTASINSKTLPAKLPFDFKRAAPSLMVTSNSPSMESPSPKPPPRIQSVTNMVLSRPCASITMPAETG